MLHGDGQPVPGNIGDQAVNKLMENEGHEMIWLVAMKHGQWSKWKALIHNSYAWGACAETTFFAPDLAMDR